MELWEQLSFLEFTGSFQRFDAWYFFLGSFWIWRVMRENYEFVRYKLSSKGEGNEERS